MDKTMLNAQLVTTWHNTTFYHLKVDCKGSNMWKSFGLVANENNEQLGFAAC